MDDYQFELLRIKAAVCPAKDGWPSPDVQVSILGDKPTIKGGALHWSALHAAVDDARERVTKAFAKMAAIDDDKSLSSAGKDLKKKEIADAAIAGFEKAKTLSSARDSVEHQISKWDKQLGLTLEQPATIGDAMIQAEIRSHLASLKAGDRMAFIDTHATEVAAAVLAAPSFLSGLTPAELGVVKQRIEASVNPEIAQAKAETAKALAHAEQGWRAAMRQISDRGGLGRPHDRMVRAATAADVERGWARAFKAGPGLPRLGFSPSKDSPLTRTAGESRRAQQDAGPETPAARGGRP